LIPALRDQFNRQFTAEKYARFLASIDSVSGTHVDFRCSETPVFFPKELLDRMAQYGAELYGQLAANPAYYRASEATIPEEYRVPNEAEHPLFVQADFGLVETEPGRYDPKLVEIQGFPSLYAFQPALAQQYKLAYALDPAYDPFLGGLTEESYVAKLRGAILGGHSPEEVVLLEIDPYHQKTLADFLITQRLTGIRIASITDVEKRGRKLYHEGKPIERIYNRVIVDELARKNLAIAFRFSDDLDVEWAGHPNWFFRLSKFSLPWFHHPSVPWTRFLNEIEVLPDDLDNYVLKPLFSFAGLGVKIGPTRDEIAAIPEAHRDQYILQEKMNFAATIHTPSGPTKAEVRIMYIWDGTGLLPVNTIVRTGRGKMMGVDFNKNLDWVGASAGFHVP
jgi:hypothetical protein